MNNRLSRLLCLWSIIIVSLTSASAQIRLGHCTDEPTTSNVRNNSTTATISCAMSLTPEMALPYTYANISHLRIALTAPQQLTSMKVWVRTSLSDTTAIASADVDLSTLVKGWNSIALNQDIPLDAQQTLYCGYSFTQSTGTYFAVSGTKGQEGSFWIASNGKWNDYSQKSAPICIQAELSSNRQHAFSLNDFQFERAFVPNTPESNHIELQYSLLNTGSQPLTQHTIHYRIAEGEELSRVIDSPDQPAQFGQTPLYSISIDLPEGLTGVDIPFSFSLSSPNGQENEDTASCSGMLYFEHKNLLPIDESTPLFIEEFTSLNNGYAPIGQHRLREAIEQTQRPTIVISRHEGYGPSDALHASHSDYTANFFGAKELAFVPAVWIEREGEPISSTLPLDSLVEIIGQTSLVRYASIDFANETYDAATRQLEVEIETSLHCITAFSNPTLIVCFTEKEVSTPNQKNYYPEQYDSSRQKDVVRCFATLPNGGSLWQGIDAEALVHGKIPAAQHAQHRLIATLLLPEDVDMQGEWHVIAFITDKDNTRKILAVSDLSTSVN